MVAVGCASVPSPDEGLETRVGAVLERRGLGRDALSVIDNLLRHGAPAPRAAPPLVLELLSRPLDAADAASFFRRTVPPALAEFDIPGRSDSFDLLLKTYIGELAAAQRLLNAATRPFADAPLMAGLAGGLPGPDALRAVADTVDRAALERASRLFIEATARFSRAARTVEWPQQSSRFQSAIGVVVIGTRGNDRHAPGAALIVDPGGDDVYERVPARDGAVSVIVDLAGDDRYSGADLALRALSAIVDFSGNDRYAMDGPGLGAAVAGASLLVDYAGNDTYEAKFFAQGAAAFGIGVLLDLGGDDSYRVTAWGQGFGLAGGTGLLWDRGGNDRYFADGVADAFNRGGGLSGAQGVAFGLRGVLAGGIGILRDDRGNDQYEAQMFAQGTGYYYGAGLLWDLGGSDRYQAVRYAQGNGVHQAVGVLRDESGDDRYDLAVSSGQGMGLDLAVGVLIDRAGSDSYRAASLAQGAATANGFGLLADGGGDDRWDLGDKLGWGRAEWLRGLPSVGVLLSSKSDAGGPLGDAPQQSEVAPARICPTVAQSAPDPGLPLSEALRRSGPGFYGEPFDVSAYAELRRRLETRLRSTMTGLPRDAPDTAWAFGYALDCALRAASDGVAAAMWRDLQEFLAADPATPFAVDIALAQRARPAPAAQADAIAELLDRHPRCSVRALALRARPRVAAAQAALGSGCWRLQSAARAALARLGAPLPADTALPSFLKQVPPVETD